ncbi:MAG: bacillithiol system redox-active protein YtxJ [Bacteroidetes bacterium]|nr:bacillithiol system redox-active protein YtxJ [Bacteroidota bacterium]
MHWNQLASIGQLSEIDEKSKRGPVAIFKHSTRCSVSLTVLDRLERNLPSDTKTENYFLDLFAFRPVSNAVAEHYGIEHESPQLLIIRDGKAVHVASHFEISPKVLLEESKPA